MPCAHTRTSSVPSLVKPDSPAKGIVEIGQLLVAIGDMDCSKMTFLQVMQSLQSKAHENVTIKFKKLSHDELYGIKRAQEAATNGDKLNPTQEADVRQLMAYKESVAHIPEVIPTDKQALVHISRGHEETHHASIEAVLLGHFRKNSTLPQFVFLSFFPFMIVK